MLRFLPVKTVAINCAEERKEEEKKATLLVYRIN